MRGDGGPFSIEVTRAFPDLLRRQNENFPKLPLTMFSDTTLSGSY